MSETETGKVTRVLYEGSLFSALGGGRNHLIGLANALFQAGVSLVVATPEQLELEQLDERILVERLQGAGIAPYRFLRYELSRFSLLWRRRENAGQTIYLTRMSLVGLAAFWASLLGYKVCIEVNGPLALEVGLKVKRARWLAGAVVRIMERIQLHSSSHVVCVSASLKDYVCGINSNVSPLVLPNGAAEFESKDEGLSEYQFNQSDKTHFVYVGAVSDWYDVESLRDLIEINSSSSALHVIGDGAGMGSLLEKPCKSMVTWGWVSNEKLNSILSYCHVGVIPAKSTSASSALRSPLKLYHYLSAGLIVVIADVIEIEPELEKYVVRYRTGDVQDLKKALELASRMPVEHAPEELWSWKSRAERLCNYLNVEPANVG